MELVASAAIEEFVLLSLASKTSDSPVVVSRPPVIFLLLILKSPDASTNSSLLLLLLSVFSVSKYSSEFYLIREEIDEPDPEDSYYRNTGSHYIGAFKTIEAAEKKESSLFMEEYHKKQEDNKYIEETFPSWKENLLKDNPKYKDYSNGQLPTT